MTDYKFITDRIEVRSIEENNKPRYIVRGTAAIANKKHTYDYSKQPDGTFNTKKSMFTPHFLESVREQAKHRKLFVDTQHELARNSSIKAMIKDKFNPEERKRIDNMLERKMLPLAKINDIDITADKLDISTELNPMFREVDEDHKNYFDAVWYSLENKFLNGISINFANFKYLKDNDGDLVIDDAEVLGFSYLDSPSEIGDSIYEVAIRAIEDKTGENTMEDEKKILEEKEAKLTEERRQLDVEKAEIQKAKDAEEAAKKTADEEAIKKAEIEKQTAEQDKIKKDLDEKTEALKKVEEEKNKVTEELNKAKGVVPQQPNPNAINSQGDAAANSKSPKFFKEQLAEITKEHDATMQTLKDGKLPMIDNSLKGMGQLVSLQAQANDLTADLPEQDVNYIRDNRVAFDRKSDSDLVLNPKA